MEKMKATFSESDMAGFLSEIKRFQPPALSLPGRTPVHVVYGGAHLFSAETSEKLGRLALNSIDRFAPDFAALAKALWLKGCENLPDFDEYREELEFQLTDDPERIRKENPDASFAWTIFQKTIDKLRREPVEDLRIDFEDGYGIRTDPEEDGHAIRAGAELARAFIEGKLPPFAGFRIKALSPETGKRALRTLDLFLSEMLERTAGSLPANFAVALPKVRRKEDVGLLADVLERFEQRNGMERGSIKLEIIIETAAAIINEKGGIALRELVESSGGRCAAVHFGAYDYTAGFGISGTHQHLGHEACNFARQMIQTALTPLGIRLSDSVTTEMPVPVHRGDELTRIQTEENRQAVFRGWRRHFNNVTRSLINGFYQSWDLHPAQLVARYAAVYAFFHETRTIQAERLRGFLDQATRALLTGNQFDDAASAQGLLNFFLRGLSCGAFSESEILRSVNLSPEELRTGSFFQIMEGRKKRSAP
ncbi:MAG: aldolase/citrate lyase family protein [Pyrinomonadaceae bacterium]